jgi:hypothetical protein
MAEVIKKEFPANLKVTIDNITVEVAPGTTILNAFSMLPERSEEKLHLRPCVFIANWMGAVENAEPAWWKWHQDRPQIRGLCLNW